MPAWLQVWIYCEANQLEPHDFMNEEITARLKWYMRWILWKEKTHKALQDESKFNKQVSKLSNG